MDATRIVGLAGYQDLEIIVEADQAPIEHPMRGVRGLQPVLDGIRTIRLDRADMGRVDLRSPAAIDELEAGHRTTRVMGAKLDPAKDAIPDGE